MRMYSLDAQQAALTFLVQQTSYIEPEVYKQRYPDVQYPQLIPVDTSANEWAKSVTYFSMDQAGRASWFSHLAKDIPKADVSREKHETTIEMAAIGYGYSLEELGQAMMIPGLNLSADRATAARRAYEEFVDDVALRGSTEKNYQGLINNTSVDVSSAAAVGNGSSTTWDDKTGDQVAADINAAITGMFTATLTIEIADTVLLPIAAMTSLATRRFTTDGGTDTTIMAWLMKNNVYTMQTGQALTIRGVRGLETAAAGGNGRMIVYRRDPSVLKLHLPMPHRFLAGVADRPDDSMTCPASSVWVVWKFVGRRRCATSMAFSTRHTNKLDA
jgi:hypothetical protein